MASDVLVTREQITELSALADSLAIAAADMPNGATTNAYANGVADTLRWLGGEPPSQSLALTLELAPGVPWPVS